jgi:AraC family transcriptional activator of mtrCDE
MSNSPSFELDNPDALSSVLSQLQLTAEVYSEGDFCGAWALDTSGSRRIPFHLIGKGEAWLHIEGHTARPLSSGDLVLFPRDCQHVIASTSVEPLATLVNAEPVSDSGPITNMVCGFFEFKNQAAWPLLNSLPAVIVMDLSDQSVSSTIRSLIDLMIAELTRRAPGYYTAINQLAYLLFIQVLRQQIQLGLVDSGLLAALFDKKISSALSAIHNNPQHAWSLESLANEAAMGRSSFARHFNELAGLPPMQYLTAWRMQLAKKLLETTRYSILDIAQRCGYESDAAFRKAFKKNMGLPPGQIRKP